MVQISQTELKRRYITIACLQKRKPQPKSEKNLAKWEKAGKLKWAKNYPYQQIINPNLNSQEFWTSNDSLPVESGTYRKIGEFKVIVQSHEFSLTVPTWKKVLQSCPGQYAIDGVGLYLLRKSHFDSHNFQKEWTVWVMKRDIPFSKSWFQKLSLNELHDLCIDVKDKGLTFTIASSIIQNSVDSELNLLRSNQLSIQNIFYRLMREFFRRQDGFEYNAFLNRSTVLKKIRTLRKEGQDVKKLIELADIMKRHPERFWMLQNID